MLFGPRRRPTCGDTASAMIGFALGFALSANTVHEAVASGQINFRILPFVMMAPLAGRPFFIGAALGVVMGGAMEMAMASSRMGSPSCRPR